MGKIGMSYEEELWRVKDELWKDERKVG